MANKKYVDENGLLYVFQKIFNLFVKKEGNKVLSDNNYSTEEKNKLAGLKKIKAGTGLTISDDGTISTTGTDIVVDTEISSTSTNPVQNKVIKVELDKKVTTVSGKGLSTNDYTTSEKNKLSGIATSAQVNKIETINVNGTAQTITNKAVNISVPTNNNQLTNGAGYQTSTQVQTLINNALKGVTSIDYKIVTELPTTGIKGTIYLISHTHTTKDVYDEYIYVNNTWEKIGNTDIDLSEYIKASELEAISNSEIDTIISTVLG
jgi:hypothetical protein